MEKIRNFSIERLGGGIFQYFICFSTSKPKSRSKPKFSQKIQIYDNKKADSIHNETNSSMQIERKKSVKFDLQLKIHVMHVWKFAYEQARKDIWQEKGRDRVRFEKRIKDLSKILTPILKK